MIRHLNEPVDNQGSDNTCGLPANRKLCTYGCKHIFVHLHLEWAQWIVRNSKERLTSLERHLPRVSGNMGPYTAIRIQVDNGTIRQVYGAMFSKGRRLISNPCRIP